MVSLQLCLGLAALAMHIPSEEWSSGGVMQWLKDEFHAEPNMTLSLLELLTVLPQVRIKLLS